MPHLQHTHTQRTCVRLEYAKLTFLFSYFNLFWDFLMYFNIFGFVSAKKKKIHVPSITKQLLLPP